MAEIVELQRNSANWVKVVDDIVRIEKKIFPKHESLARSFDEELKKKNSGLLYTQLVKENYRGQGHGEKLLEAAVQKCRTRNVHRISLHVDPTRTAAMQLYKKLGFQVDTLVEGYYSSDRNAYRMYLDFDME
ncbi:N-alpha-acetyltransferase 30-like isoform X2 [Solanum tuberosum]|uniref:N-alpha-acetyltransferase 30-like isoform X2 n=1 Tax=Solanum tuberosum TaxID=4113 RepID=UPI0003D27A09|nr:PREDICTED: N-alpha-acetyltransferase 30-like isoform X2 [Solanum tuberosum]